MLRLIVSNGLTILGLASNAAVFVTEEEQQYYYDDNNTNARITATKTHIHFLLPLNYLVG